MIPVIVIGVATAVVLSSFSNKRQRTRSTCKQLPYCNQHTKSELGVKEKTSTISRSGLGLFALKALRKGQRIVPCTRGSGGYSNSKPGENNASLVTNAAAKTVSIRASKNVRPGQEIFTSYGPGYFKRPNDPPKPIYSTSNRKTKNEIPFPPKKKARRI